MWIYSENSVSMEKDNLMEWNLGHNTSHIILNQPDITRDDPPNK